MPRLLVAITGHGYGHAAQAAPVVQTLKSWAPEVEIFVRSHLPERRISDFFPGARFAGKPIGDFGMLMRSAFTVDQVSSLMLYADLHRDFAARLDEETADLADLAPDAVFADVPYLTLAAAARLGIPSIGMSSLNWADIYRGFSQRRIEGRRIVDEMMACYASASLFLACTPAMPMPALQPRVIGPVCRTIIPNRAELGRRLRLGLTHRLILVSLGGIDTELPLAHWPAIPGVQYIVAAPNVPVRPDMVPFAALGMDHLAVLASCDALITKPGYASLVEAVCHGVPVLYAPRSDWPEERALIDWLETQGVAERIDRTALALGDLARPLGRLFSRSRKIPIVPTGNTVAATLVAKALQAGMQRRPAG